MAWNPYSGMPNNQWNIDGNNCNPWKVTKPDTANPGSITWSMQVTAPLPFEAINDLFASAISNPTSPLLPALKRQASSNVVSVTKEFFQSKPNGISQDDVKADVLGFLSLVISYIKFAKPTDPPNYQQRSPKFTISIMPRTEFVTLYSQIKLPGTGSLYNLLKTLACYKNYEDDVE